MIFAILIGVGFIGIALTLWVSHPKMYYERPLSEEPWYVLHPENFESGLIEELRRWFRELLKWVLIRMIALYRALSEKVTVKQMLKKRIRAFLYEHRNGEERNPSPFWNKVRKERPSGPGVETNDSL